MPKYTITPAFVAGGWDDCQEFGPSDRDVWVQTDLGSILITSDDSARSAPCYFVAGPDAKPELLSRIAALLNEDALDLEGSPSDLAESLRQVL